MAGKTIALPLSGDEIKTALLDMVEQALTKNWASFLHSASAYDFMVGRVTIDLTLNDMGREDELKVDETIKSAGAEPETAKRDIISIPIAEQPPNEVRVETGQGIPTESGKKIKYSRKTAAKKS